MSIIKEFWLDFTKRVGLKKLDKIQVGNSDSGLTQYTDIDDIAKLVIGDGTANGQIIFWNGTEWVHTEVTELYWDDVNKRLGIGATSANYKVDIVQASAGNNVVGLNLQNNSASAGTSCSLRFTPTSSPTIRYSEIQAINENGSNDIDIAFVTGNGSSIDEVMRIKANNKVGILEEIPDEAVTIGGNGDPSVDNTYSWGKDGRRWTALWAVNGTIQTSDERQKKDIETTALGLNFIDMLDPISYKRIEEKKIEVETEELQEIERQVFTEEEIETETVKLINGKYKKVKETEIKRTPIFEEVDLYDENDKKIGKHLIPKMEIVEVPVKNKHYESVSGTKTHLGLIAQQVKSVCDNLGIDFAGHILTDEEDPDSNQGLIYSEFIAPLIKAVQELKSRIETLENK